MRRIEKKIIFSAFIFQKLFYLLLRINSFAPLGFVWKLQLLISNRELYAPQFLTS